MLNIIRVRWREGIVLLVLLCAGTIAAVKGLELRRWIWDYSQGAHFKGDIGNAFYWGNYAEEHGLFSVYESNAAENEGVELPTNPQLRMAARRIDYPPLRLTAAWLWYRWAHRHYPDATAWQDNYDFTSPLLDANTVAEATSALLVFCIVWIWRRHEEVIDSKSLGWKPALTGAGGGLLGAMMLWFNPAVLWDGHCWPQWDIWPVPLFLLALLLALFDFWFIAGICIAIAASLKGQILLGAPVLLIWPIFRGPFGAPLRLISGFMLMTALIALPWMQPSGAGYRWLLLCGVAMAGMMPFVLGWKKPLLGSAALPIAAMLVWQWGATDGNATKNIGYIAIGVGLFAAIRYLPAKLKFPTIALFAAGIIFSLMQVYHAGIAWYEYGFKYGTEKYEFMVTGSGAYNIPRMLQVYWRWPPQTTEEVKLPFVNASVTFTQLTRIVYAITLLFCGIGAAIHHRRRDAQFLAAMVAPWLLFFMILTQMHGRYTIWAAAICALLAGVSIGAALLGIIVGFVSFLGIMHNQLMFSRDWSPDTLRLLNRLDPSAGFFLLLIAGIWFYLAVTPRKRAQRKENTSALANR